MKFQNQGNTCEMQRQYMYILNKQHSYDMYM